MGDADNLSTSSSFASFGEIEHLRIIPQKQDSPSQLFIKYLSSTAAERAIQWSLEKGLSAKHGYQRYCKKWLSNKRCQRQNCPNLHRWASREDIIDADEAENFSAAAREPNQKKNDDLQRLQKQCYLIMRMCAQQSLIINNLNRQLHTLLTRQSNDDSEFGLTELELDLDAITDEIVERMFDVEDGSEYGRSDINSLSNTATTHSVLDEHNELSFCTDEVEDFAIYCEL